MFKKIFIAFISSLVSMILILFILDGIENHVNSNYEDYFKFFLWGILGVYFPITLIIPFIFSNLSKNKTIDKFIIFCLYSILISLVIVASIPFILIFIPIETNTSHI